MPQRRLETRGQPVLIPCSRREANMMVAAIVFALAMSVHSFLEGFALLQVIVPFFIPPLQSSEHDQPNSRAALGFTAS